LIYRKKAARLSSEVVDRSWLAQQIDRALDLQVGLGRGAAMTRIVVETNINAPIATVFDYATTPVNWPKWHPASRAVSGTTDHSLLLGERVAEEFVVAGNKGSCVWSVVRRVPPLLWAIATVTPQGRAEITYRLSAPAGQRVLLEIDA
jgi:hypothetical protein